MKGSRVTCAHALAELEQALEGENRDVRGTPFSSGRVVVLLKAHPASGLLPAAALELIQLHISL